jgi:phenylalanyl-tRNA synthetase beta chain
MIRQVLDYLLLNLGLEKRVSIVSCEHKSFVPGRVGKIFVDKREVGFIGEVHPQVLANFSLEMPVGAFEIDLNLISELVR